MRHWMVLVHFFLRIFCTPRCYHSNLHQFAVLKQRIYLVVCVLAIHFHRLHRLLLLCGIVFYKSYKSNVDWNYAFLCRLLFTFCHRLPRCLFGTYCPGLSTPGHCIHVWVDDDGLLGRCRRRRPVHDDYKLGVSFEIHVFLVTIHVTL
jgi:hypothetical protein